MKMARVGLPEDLTRRLDQAMVDSGKKSEIRSALLFALGF